MGLTLFIVDVGAVFSSLRVVPLFLISFLVILGLLRTWLTGVRWQVINPDPQKQLSRWDYFRLVMIAGSFNLIMPGALGGDIAKAVMTANRVQTHRTANLIGIVTDRFIGLSSIVLLGAFSMLFMTRIPDRNQFFIYFAILAAGMVSLVITTSSKWVLSLLQSLLAHLGNIGARLIRILNSWRQAMQYFRHEWRRVLLALGLCLPIHGLSFITIYLLARALDIPVSFFDVSMVLALVWVVTVIPLSISGIGVRELSMIYLLGLYGITPESATALSLLFYLVTVLLGLIGVCFIWTRKHDGVSNE